MATQTLEELLVLIEASTAGLREELNKGIGDVTSFEKKIEGNVSRIDSRFKKLGSTLRTALGAFGISVGVTGLVRFGQSAIKTADAIGDAARVANFSADRFQRLRRVFEESGVTTNEFDASMQRLNRRLGLFVQTGGGPAAAAIKQLGLEQDITSGKISTAEQLYDAVVGRLEGVESGARAAAIASAFFGDEAGPKLAQTLRIGTQAMREAEAAAKGIFSESQIAAAQALDDAYKKVVGTIGTDLKGALIDVSVGFSQLLGLTDEVGKDAIEKLRLLQDIERTQKRIQLLENAGPMRFAFEGGQGALDFARNRLEDLQRQERISALRTPFGERGRARDERDAAERRRQEAEQQRRGLAQLERGATVPVGALLRQLPGSITNFDPNSGGAEPARRAEEARRELERNLGDLEEQSLRAQDRMAEAIRLNADQQIAQWQRVAEETPEYADQAARAIVLINERATAEIKTLGEKAQTKMKEFAAAFVATFESRGIEALFSGKLRNAVRGFTKDLAELIIRMTTLKPLAEAIANSLSKIGKDDESDTTSNIIGGLLGFSGGGRPPMGRASLVGEHGPELWVPDTPGRIISNAQSQRLAMAGGGINVRVEQHLQVGLPPQWHAQMAAGAQVAAKTARDAVMKELGGRR
jgi:hypothetical protein